MSLKNIISKSNETEEKALESKHVLLWGLNKVSSKLMKKAEAEFKPTKRTYTKKEGVVEKVKVPRYDPTNEDYTEEDLPFLNKEYERISAIVDNPKTDEAFVIHKDHLTRPVVAVGFCSAFAGATSPAAASLPSRSSIRVRGGRWPPETKRRSAWP